jgi:hypothetical protein
VSDSRHLVSSGSLAIGSFFSTLRPVVFRLLFKILLLVGVLGHAGCGGGHRELSPTEQRITRVDLFGHMCVQLTNSIGTRILLNPFSPGSTRHPVPRGLRPHILLVTNERPDVNYVDITDASPRIFRGRVAEGTNNASGIPVLGIPTGGDNVAFTWMQDGMRFLFPGSLTGPLDESALRRVGRVDVLLLPVGAPAGLSDASRHRLVEQLQPALVVPIAGTRANAERFAQAYGDVVTLPGRSFLISKASLPRQPFPRILLLDL